MYDRTVQRARLIGPGVLVAAVFAAGTAFAQTPELSGPAKPFDTNGNGVIERNEAQGPAAVNFDTIDLNNSGSLDGDELRHFFAGGPRPASAPAASNADIRLPDGKTASGPPRARVELDAVIEEQIGQTTPVVGRIVARQTGPVAARVNGAVLKMQVDVGDRVDTGDVLVIIDQERMQLERDRYAAIVTQQRANLAAERAGLKQTQNELKRLEGIRNSVAFSQARYEDAVQAVASQTGNVAQTRAQLAQARAQLKRADRDLADTSVVAPYPGIVSETQTEIGAYLSVGNPVATIINDRDLEVEADVPTSRIASLNNGDVVNIRIADGQVVPATLRAVVPTENPRTRTRPVRFTPEFDGIVLPLANNQSVTVLLPVGGSRNAVTVSKDAITQRNGQNMVFVSNNGRAQPRAVTTGEATGSRLVVLSGLRAGDLVVVRGNERLRPGQRLVDVDASPTNDRGGG
ncbi:MAG: efflux transporter periplasmic adaptor subunit [Rhodospirillaceae bacterium]|nr:efflux transporter periplasmic adaptor subunit [Rhodospirillaceae bacterium]